MNLSGIFPPICTPFSTDGSLATAALKHNIGLYNRSSIAGYVVTGSTGEAVMLSDVERMQAWDTVRETSAPGKLLIAGTAAQSIRETLALTHAAHQRGYDAALVLTPYFFKAQMLRPESQIAFFHGVAEEARIPLILYNFPQMTAIDLPPDVIARIVEHPNIVAVKESSADLKKIEALRASLPPGYPLLVGASAMFETCLKLGATGGILASANALPNATCKIYDRYSRGDFAGARAAQEAIREAAAVAPRFGVQGLKYGMDLKGFFGGECRLPLLPLDAVQKAEIAALFNNVQE